MDTEVTEKVPRVLQLESESDANLAVQVLQDAGIVVTTMQASTEPAFKKAMQEFSPDLVLCDIGMTPYSGVNALSFTLVHYPTVPVIVITDAIEDGNDIKLLELGARDYVRKGNLERLPFAVRRALKEQQRLVDYRQTRQTRQNKSFLPALLDHSNDAIELVDMDTMCFVDINEGACRALGYTRDELLSMTVADIDPKFKANQDSILNAIKDHGEACFESIHQRKDGSIFPVEISAKIIMLDKLYGLSIARDISDRKHAERNLYLFRALFDQTDDAIEIIEPVTARFIDVNEGACRELGYSREELLSMTVADIDPGYAQHPEEVRTPLQESMEFRFETVHRRKDGSCLPVEVFLKNVEYEGETYGLAITHDISERKRIEDTLRDSEEKYRTIFENSPLGIFRSNIKGQLFIEVNPALATMFGFDSPEQMICETTDIASQLYASPADREKVVSSQLQAPGDVMQHLCHYKRHDGGELIANLYLKTIRDAEDNPAFFEGIVEDITESKRAEQERQGLLQDIRHGSSELETIFATQTDVILVYDLNTKVRRCTPKFKQEYGFDPIGMHLRHILLNVNCRRMDDRPVVYSEDLPTPRALQGEQIFSSPFRVTHADGNDVIVEASSTPLYVDDNIKGVVSVWHDVTELRKAAEEINAYATQLENAMMGTLKAVSSMVETRDPYTAGHERRVGLIAADIAREMRWPENQCKALELAGLVHDIGKIGIPSEILTKPTRLSNEEFQLIKQHAEIGYNILKDIEFAFPVAEIAYQHHERVDGSGYPQGLKGDEILPEARIMAVADVLESMASHRPYRPALGIDKALDELIKHREVLYDADAVDAMLRLIQQKGYRLPE